MNQTQPKQPISEQNLQNRESDQKPLTNNKKEAWHMRKIYAFAIALLIPALIGLLFFLRPSVSESEKRELTKFPTLSWDSLLSGDYFSQITTWYADTYPGREGLISANQSIRALFGIRTVQIIPSKPDASSNAANPDNTPIEKLGSVYIKGDTAYELYGKNDENSKRYANLLSQAAKQLNGSAKVYSMIVPLSSSVNLSEEELKKVGASDAPAAIAEMYAQMENVTPVNIYNTLRAHNREYLYFRTDHHWTALGAYYAYTDFCSIAGLPSYPLSNWKEYQFEGFLGTLYADAGNPEKLRNNPDTVHAWVPNGTNTIEITNKSNKSDIYKGGVVRTDTDTFYAAKASKYNCFIMGDNPLSKIHNPTIGNGTSIAVVKESFGNALIPFLVDHYEYVYVIDYRYFTATTGYSLQEFVKEKEIPTVLFINNLTATSATPRLNELAGMLAD